MPGSRLTHDSDQLDSLYLRFGYRLFHFLKQLADPVFVRICEAGIIKLLLQCSSGIIQ